MKCTSLMYNAIYVFIGSDTHLDGGLFHLQHTALNDSQNCHKVGPTATDL